MRLFRTLGGVLLFPLRTVAGVAALIRGQLYSGALWLYHLRVEFWSVEGIEQHSGQPLSLLCGLRAITELLSPVGLRRPVSRAIAGAILALKSAEGDFGCRQPGDGSYLVLHQLLPVHAIRRLVPHSGLGVRRGRIAAQRKRFAR